MLWCALGALAVIAVFASAASRMRPQQTQTSKYADDFAISQESTALFTSETALFSYVKKFGPRETVQRLAELAPRYGSCHDNAHKTGRFAYELFGDRAFKECSAECHSGCYHGATEAYFKDNGTANLEKNLNTLCSSELNPFFSHQCIHGIGHGLMAWANYGLFDALKSCDLLSKRQDSCWTGVFMENIIGSLASQDAEAPSGSESGHFTKYLSNDPLYPCSNPQLDEKYKSSCYFLQTSRMMQLFAGDFAKVASACKSAPATYQRSCFESMGRDVGGSHRDDPAGVLASCQNAPKGNFRIGCLNGAVQDMFWDPSGQDKALNFCALLTDRQEKDECYTVVFSRAPDILPNASDLDSFCSRAETDYQNRCRETARR
jgi:hypothetical protein